MTLAERLERAAEARRITESRVFQDAFDRFTADIAALRLQVGPRDSDGAHRLVLMEQTVVKARRYFEEYMQDGDMAAKELAQQEGGSTMGRMARRLSSIV